MKRRYFLMLSIILSAGFIPPYAADTDSESLVLFDTNKKIEIDVTQTEEKLNILFGKPIKNINQDDGNLFWRKNYHTDLNISYSSDKSYADYHMEYLTLISGRFSVEDVQVGMEYKEAVNHLKARDWDCHYRNFYDTEAALFAYKPSREASFRLYLKIINDKVEAIRFYR